MIAQGEYYSEFDPDCNLWCIFHTEASKAFASYSNQTEAEEAARNMNKEIPSNNGLDCSNNMSNYIKVLNKFWESFHRSPLYETGFGDFVSNCKADRAKIPAEVYCALSYLKGAADMARIANIYMSPRWQICNLIAIATVAFHTVLENSSSDTDQAELCAQVQRLADQYIRELTELVNNL